MRRLLFAFLCCSFPVWALFPNGYSYAKLITLDHTMVSGSSDLSSFTRTISGTDANLAVAGSGGRVQSSSGYDIVFDNSPTCSGSGTALKWDQEKWVSTTGQYAYHVLITTLHYLTDDKICMYYGKSGVSSFQGGGTTAYDSHYKAVYHMENVSSIVDATGNVATGFTANSPTNQAGKLDGAMGTGFGAQAILGTAAALQSTTFTYSAWAYWPSSPTNRGAILACAASQGCPQLANQGTDLTLLKQGNLYIGRASAVLSAGAWYHVAASYNGTNYALYVNGSNVLSGTNAQTFSGSPFDFRIGWSGDGSSAHNGYIDELRISDIVRSSDWIMTEYRNQNSPSSYLTFSAELTGPLGGATTFVRHRVTQGGN